MPEIAFLKLSHITKHPVIGSRLVMVLVLDARDEPIEGRHLVAAVGERLVPNGQLAREHEERSEEPFPCCQVEAVVLVLAVDERRGMERDVGGGP